MSSTRCSATGARANPSTHPASSFIRRDTRVLPADINAAGEAIEAFTEGMDGDDWAESDMVQATVERKFEIIGEAMNRLRKDAPDLTKRIPGIRNIADSRNLLAHGYDFVDSELVWTYAKNDTIESRRAVRGLLAELESSCPEQFPGGEEPHPLIPVAIPDPCKPPLSRVS